MAIYFLSDPHFCHARDFIYSPRGFHSASDMNSAIIKNWNSVVKSNDDVYLLGDIMLNNNDEGLKCLKSLKGKIHIILGNHDTLARIKLYESCYNVVEVVAAKYLEVDGFHFFLSHYPCLCANGDEHKPLEKRVISICGHTHTKDKFSDMGEGLIYHVDCDAHNCTPVSFDEIINDIQSYIKDKKN